MKTDLEVSIDQDKPWWLYAQSPSLGATHGFNSSWIREGVTFKCLSEGIELYEESFNGYHLKGDINELYSKIKSLGLKLFHHKYLDYSGDTELREYFINKNGGIVVGKDGDFLQLCVITSEKEVYENFLSFSKDYCTKAESKGNIHIMVSTPDGITLSPVGSAKVAFEPENYNTEVVEQYQYVVKELCSPNPSGRLVILDGIMGSGKTYLCRSLIEDVKNAVFIFIPSSMISGLSSPDLIPVLMKTKNSFGGIPIILVVEDADECLVKRSSQNMSSVSVLLNMSNGIIGDIIDIRIVCTTNANQEEMDPAILRDERLLKKIEFGYLSGERAAKIFKRLTGKDRDFKDFEYTLANIYKLSKGEGYEPVLEKTHKKHDAAGFRLFKDRGNF